MLTLIFLSSSLIISIIFFYMKHPLAMGLILLIQTFFVCLITGLLSKSFWFSYILFLTFLGGMLILFIYITSLASNEMFSLSMNILLIIFSMFMMIFFIFMILDKMILIYFFSNLEMMSILNLNSFLNENALNLNKLYNFPMNMITILLINYLFLTLIAIVKITNINYGPLRTKN
uniref:NADH-ubiquinone oxidoreductase chain 6 n=1 Tax=Protoplasa fitchii TaxID=560777 RepID=G8J8D5_9DIPT|nr:NADH dehydrogenase subunit 6 [Protoplasa fitchii]AET13053.1 NADH dehydrogenase subunit 6 [Protoplasa fitchii]